MCICFASEPENIDLQFPLCECIMVSNGKHIRCDMKNYLARFPVCFSYSCFIMEKRQRFSANIIH